MTSARHSWWGTLAREPLAHFVVLGGALVGLSSAFSPDRTGGDSHVIVGVNEAARLRALYAQQWGAPPSPQDMPRLVEEYVRQEILFREGKKMGFDAGDLAIRNRIVQKMTYLLDAPIEADPPTAPEVASFFEQHAARYVAPEQIGFLQIYFSPARRGAGAEKDARQALQSLRIRPSDGGIRGDPLLLALDPSPRRREEVAADFGNEFATALFGAPLGSWSGPFRSAHGFHLVRVLEHAPAHLPELAEVRDAVVRDMINERRQVLSERAYGRIRDRYKVTLDPSLLPAATRPAAP